MAPAMAVRATKFNLPWSAYRESKSMDYHLSTCRDLRLFHARRAGPLLAVRLRAAVVVLQAVGRLSYDQATPDKVFELAFEGRYGAGRGKSMLRAYELVSIMPLRLASFLSPPGITSSTARAFWRPCCRNATG